VVCCVGFINGTNQSSIDTWHMRHVAARPTPAGASLGTNPPTHPPTTHHPRTSSSGFYGSSIYFLGSSPMFGKFWDVFRSSEVFSEVRRVNWEVPACFGKFPGRFGKLPSTPQKSSGKFHFWKILSILEQKENFSISGRCPIQNLRSLKVQA
jgi:hypothetical protein